MLARTKRFLYAALMAILIIGTISWLAVQAWTAILDSV